MSKRGYRYFTEAEDDSLRHWAKAGATLKSQAEGLKRPLGSIKTRRRILGLSKTSTRQEAPVASQRDPLMETMRRYVIYFYGGCLFAAGLLAFLGDV